MDIPATLRQIPVSRQWIHELVKRGELQRVKIGKRVFITQASIDAYIDRLVEAV